MEPKRDLFSIGEGSLYIRKCRSQFFIEPGVESSSLHIHCWFGLAAGLAILPSRRLECSLPAEDRNVSNSVLLTGEMKAEFVRILPHVQSFFSCFPRDLYH